MATTLKTRLNPLLILTIGLVLIVLISFVDAKPGRGASTTKSAAKGKNYDDDDEYEDDEDEPLKPIKKPTPKPSKKKPGSKSTTSTSTSTSTTTTTSSPTFPVTTTTTTTSTTTSKPSKGTASEYKASSNVDLTRKPDKDGNDSSSASKKTKKDRDNKKSKTSEEYAKKLANNIDKLMFNLQDIRVRGFTNRKNYAKRVSYMSFMLRWILHQHKLVESRYFNYAPHGEIGPWVSSERREFVKLG